MGCSNPLRREWISERVKRVGWKDAETTRETDREECTTLRFTDLLFLRGPRAHAPRAYNYVRIDKRMDVLDQRACGLSSRRHVPINVFLMLFNELQFHSFAKFSIFFLSFLLCFFILLFLHVAFSLAVVFGVSSTRQKDFASEGKATQDWTLASPAPYLRHSDRKIDRISMGIGEISRVRSRSSLRSLSLTLSFYTSRYEFFTLKPSLVAVHRLVRAVDDSTGACSSSFFPFTRSYSSSPLLWWLCRYYHDNLQII